MSYYCDCLYGNLFACVICFIFVGVNDERCLEQETLAMIAAERHMLLLPSISASIVCDSQHFQFDMAVILCTVERHLFTDERHAGIMPSVG